MAELEPWALVEGLGLPAAVIAMLMWFMGKFFTSQAEGMAKLQEGQESIKSGQASINTRLGDTNTRIESLCGRIDRLVDK